MPPMPTATEVAPWGGSLSMDNAVSWDFGNPATATCTDQEVLASGAPPKNHFYSVLVHEIAHVLGYGTSDSFDNLVSTSPAGPSVFTGAATTALNGGSVTMHSDDSHWASGTMSNVYGTTTSQEVSLAPSILTGTVKLMTDLDVAALDDIGWTITPVPEPNAMAFCGLAVGLVFSHKAFQLLKSRLAKGKTLS